MSTSLSTNKENLSEVSKRKKNNAWLKDPLFFENLEFHDKVYLREFFDILYSFVFKLPIPVLTTWDPIQKRVFISLGGNTITSIYIKTDTAFYDYLVIIEKYLSKLYPSYTVETLVESTYSVDEIVEIMKRDGATFDEVFGKKKLTSLTETGVIDRVYFNDNFRITVNDQTQLRLAEVPISYFLKALRNIKNQKERKDYIFETSRFLKELELASVNIDYNDDKLINFIIINKSEIKTTPYRSGSSIVWGKFLIKLPENTIVKEKALTLLGI